MILEPAIDDELPISEPELAKARDRQTDQRAKATDTLSTTLRTIGMGLAAIAYSFVFATAPNAELAKHRGWLFIASLFGGLSIAVDIVQSFTERHVAQSTLDFFKARRQEGRMPTGEEIEQHRNLSGGRHIQTMLFVRAGMATIGIGCLLAAIAFSLRAPASGFASN